MWKNDYISNVYELLDTIICGAPLTTNGSIINC